MVFTIVYSEDTSNTRNFLLGCCQTKYRGKNVVTFLGSRVKQKNDKFGIEAAFEDIIAKTGMDNYVSEKEEPLKMLTRTDYYGKQHYEDELQSGNQTVYYNRTTLIGNIDPKITQDTSELTVPIREFSSYVVLNENEFLNLLQDKHPKYWLRNINAKGAWINGVQRWKLKGRKDNMDSAKFKRKISDNSLNKKLLIPLTITFIAVLLSIYEYLFINRYLLSE